MSLFLKLYLIYNEVYLNNLTISLNNNKPLCDESNIVKKTASKSVGSTGKAGSTYLLLDSNSTKLIKKSSALI